MTILPPACNLQQIGSGNLYAIDNNYIIATQDADFYEMGLIHGQPPKIIWLKMGNQSKATTINALINNREFIYQALIVEDKECVEIF